MTKIGWDVTHQEFTVEDHYYFSKLKEAILKEGMKVEEVSNWKDLKNYDTIVFNYPEIPFKRDEVDFVEELVARYGKKVILLGYYKNEDRIAEVCNSLSERFGMLLNHDEVIDEKNNHEGDKYLITTTKIRRYKEGVRKIVLPCCASIKTVMPDVKIVARAEDDYTLLIAEQIHPQSGGYFCLCGTCVFWDNYSITLYDNLRFSLNLLKHQRKPRFSLEV